MPPRLPTIGWNLSDLPPPSKDAPTVMSTFACGGGSSMGYKRAGFRVVAANDIDPKMAENYQANLTVDHYFLEPIGDVVARAKSGALPKELYELDVLDGSPPCSTFSLAGSREKAWGVEKKFREGQAKQVLSDLFFDYLDLVEALRPKVSIAENVKGMLVGNAKGYTRLVVQRYREIGYNVQVFLLNGAACGVPQRRERVFFVAVRADLNLPPIDISPDLPPITLKKAWAGLDPDVETKAASPLTERAKELWLATPQGRSFVNACEILHGKSSYFNWVRLAYDEPAATLPATASTITHPAEPRQLSPREYARLGSFPDDYQTSTGSTLRYMVGMSVPPPMTEAVARAVREQWLSKL